MHGPHHNAFEETPSNPVRLRPCRVLLALSGDHRDSWCDAVRRAGHLSHNARTPSECERALERRGCEVILIDPGFANGCGMDLARRAAHLQPHARMILVMSVPSTSVVIDGLRLGVVDAIEAAATQDTMIAAIQRAVRKSRLEERNMKRVDRLREMCRKLNESRQESYHQVEVLCQDLANAYDDVARQIDDATFASELRTLLSQELDLESLLRTTLQYMLTRTGPTNAAVFLPDELRQYSLGAYCNYDCPRDTADVLLEHFCRSVCPHMEGEPEIVRYDDADELADFIGPEASFLHGSQMIAFRCHHGDECLAVMVLFRSAGEPFDDDLPRLIDTIRTIFARQIARVIRIHHRARPEWPQEAGEDLDLDDEYGLGGLAA